MHPYRIFISYARKDRPLAEMIVAHLQNLKAVPLWDKHLPQGVRFTDSIKNKIAYAHICLVLFTSSSARSPWVHQELGYALGLDVPLLLLSLHKEPDGLTHDLQATFVSADLSDLDEHLTQRAIERLVGNYMEKSSGKFECAVRPDSRKEKLQEFLHAAKDLAPNGALRHWARFSSFSVPNEPTDAAIWDQARYRAGDDISTRDNLLYERRKLEEYVRNHGLDLRVYPYYRPPDDMPGSTQAARLRILCDFLDDLRDDQVRVVIERGPTPGNLLILGDWFFAEVGRPSSAGGYMFTSFTRHAPTVLLRAERFDQDFAAALRTFMRQGQPGQSSRKLALEQLNELVVQLDREGSTEPA